MSPTRILLAACALLLSARPAAAGAAEACVARSPELRGGQPAQPLALDVSRAETLALSARGFSWGQAVWGEAILLGRDGSTNRLCDLKPESAQVGWYTFMTNRGPDSKALRVAEREFAHGLFAHADSCVVYRLDKKFVRFQSWVGVSHTAGAQGRVVFEAADQTGLAWSRTVARMRKGFTPGCLASLGRALARAPATAPAARVAELRARLRAFEAEFAALRAALEADPEPVRARLDAFPDLVRDIRFLQLDAPLLFVKRHPYFSGHIYDDYLTWHPGGGIYVLENPADLSERQRVRPLIDPKTPVSLGEGVYRDPELSFDARRLLFAFKGEAQGGTSLYELDLVPPAGTNAAALRRLTYPDRDCPCAAPPAGLIGHGHHDISPCYLPDGRIAFLSTRTSGLVMCFNNFIATLHAMNADGTDLRPISVNNVSEFDPTLLPDGRILYGRWEYVDKTALYMQSLWTVNPDGTQETALFKNNLAKPTAVLDARPVPGSGLIVASLTPHNGQSVGAIAMIDPRAGKNTLAAIANFTPEYPTEMDQGLARGPSDPWPLDEDTVLIADNAEEHGPHGVLRLIDRYGFRFTVRSEADLSCYSPVPLRPSPRPPAQVSRLAAGAPARFFVHDLYQGLPGVRRGEVKRLRVLETTSRVSGVPPGGRWWNQAFLVSWQGSYDVKNFLGTVPVEEDGSAWFEAPPGKALYFQALDADGRLVQSMRTFVQAAPGLTRSCRGCHVADDAATPQGGLPRALALRKPPAQLAPESWGGGFLDFPSMVQPVLDRRCVRCHGGEGGLAGGLDFSGGWTWAFNLAYETMLKNTLAGFLNCNNGSVRTAELLPPRAHGSGAAPLAAVLASGHRGRLAGMPSAERELLFAWMDGNCNYAGTWDYSPCATCAAALALETPLLAEMDRAGCLRCHERKLGNDWVNLQTPERSRLLRAPLAADVGGLGWCREGHAPAVREPLVNQGVQPPDVFRPWRAPPPGAGATSTVAVATFEATTNASYRAMLALVAGAREEALRAPRADMPGAAVTRGRCRELPALAPPMLPATAEAPKPRHWWWLGLR